MASDTNLTAIRAAAPGDTGEKTVFKILLTISFCHLLNDTLQSLIPAIYPLLKNSFHLDFGQVGLIALTLQLTASATAQTLLSQEMLFTPDKGDAACRPCSRSAKRTVSRCSGRPAV